jgi:hypothetical protein
VSDHGVSNALPEPTPYSLLLEIADSERSRQLARVDSINAIASALLGFEAVLVVLLPGFAWGRAVRDLSISLLWTSIVFLFLCLLNFPMTWLVVTKHAAWKKWRKNSRGVAAISPRELSTYLPEPKSVTESMLWSTQSAMIESNHNWLLAPKRRNLTCAVVLLVLSIGILGISALVQ